jgi:hypothetical protein
MARGTAKSDMATTLARATGSTRAEALQTMKDAGIPNTPAPKAKRAASVPDERQQRLLTNLGDMKDKEISTLASAISRDWSQSDRGINFAARPYIDAMMSLGGMGDKYMNDDAKEIVVRFLSNATGWRGPVAKAVKAELNRRLKVKEPRERVNRQGIVYRSGQDEGDFLR